MSSSSAPPPQFYSPGQPVAPPNKKTRAGMTPGTDKVLSETDQAMARRRIELDRLKQMQKQHMPVMNNARDQLQGRGVTSPGAQQPSLPSPNRPSTTTMLPPGNGPPVIPSNARNPNAGTLSRRLDESFISSPRNASSRVQVVSPLSSPSSQRLVTPANVTSLGGAPIIETSPTFNGSSKLSNGVSSSVHPPPTTQSSFSMQVGTPVRGPPPGPPPTPSLNAASVPASLKKESNQSQHKPKSHVSFGQVIENSPPPQSYSSEDQNAVSSPQVSDTLVTSAGHTPFPSKSDMPQNQFETPTYSLSSEDQPPISTGRSEMLNAMRSYADTPPSKFADPLSTSTQLPGNGNKDKKHVGFLTPVMNASTPGLDALITSPLALSKRAPTPHPKLSRSITMQDEFLIEAAEIVTFEYESDAAIFTVRRPYGLATETELWFSAGYLNSKMYAKNANVTRPETFEVVATIVCDGSILALHGDVEVRHRQIGDTMWKEFGNIRNGDSFLGNITYIDKDANEKQYSLDMICEGALAVREHYCSSMLSTGEAFRVRNELRPNLLQVSENVPVADTLSPMKPPTSDASVGTDDPQEGQASNAPMEVPPPSFENQPVDGTTDVLSSAVALFFSTIFGVIWFVLVRIPIMVVTHIFVIFVAAVFLSVIRLYAAEDNGAAELGAVINTMFNRAGIF